MFAHGSNTILDLKRELFLRAPKPFLRNYYVFDLSHSALQLSDDTRLDSLPMELDIIKLTVSWHTTNDLPLYPSPEPARLTITYKGPVEFAFIGLCRVRDALTTLIDSISQKVVLVSRESTKSPTIRLFSVLGAPVTANGDTTISKWIVYDVEPRIPLIQHFGIEEDESYKTHLVLTILRNETLSTKMMVLTEGAFERTVLDLIELAVPHSSEELGLYHNKIRLDPSKKLCDVLANGVNAYLEILPQNPPQQTGPSPSSIDVITSPVNGEAVLLDQFQTCEVNYEVYLANGAKVSQVRLPSLQIHLNKGVAFIGRSGSSAMRQLAPIPKADVKVNPTNSNLLQPALPDRPDMNAEQIRLYAQKAFAAMITIIKYLSFTLALIQQVPFEARTFQTVLILMGAGVFFAVHHGALNYLEEFLGPTGARVRARALTLLSSEVLELTKDQVWTYNTSLLDETLASFSFGDEVEDPSRLKSQVREEFLGRMKQVKQNKGVLRILGQDLAIFFVSMVPSLYRQVSKLINDQQAKFVQEVKKRLEEIREENQEERSDGPVPIESDRENNRESTGFVRFPDSVRERILRELGNLSDDATVSDGSETTVSEAFNNAGSDTDIEPVNED